MRKVKFAKAEYVAMINGIAMILALAHHFMGVTMVGAMRSAEILPIAGAVASVWFCIFVSLRDETYTRRWMTRREKCYMYAIYAAVSISVTLTVGFSWINLLIFLGVTALWAFLFAFGAHTPPEEIDSPMPVCEHAYVYESDEQTMKDFQADGRWYSRRKEKRLRETYTRTAREFSGKLDMEQIELLVQERILHRKLRGQKIAICLTLAGCLTAFFVTPWMAARMEIIVYLAVFLNLYGVLRFIACLNAPLTPNESRRFVRRDTAEKTGE